MTEQDLKNNEIITKLVSNHFSLSESGLKLFKNALNNEREKYIDENILKILGPDFRADFPLGNDIKEDMDEGWMIFIRIFRSFIDSYEEENDGKKIEYSNYSENKLVVDKQEVKLFKYIKKWYSEQDIAILDDFKNRARNYIPGVYYSSSFEDSLKIAVEHLGTKKIPSQNMKLVISCNFADWFLVSTGENSYSSCLDLESNYEAAYWAGLPGLIVDKNRILIYITDGKTKEYEGIKVNRIVSRTWGLIDEEDVVHTVRFYPSEIMNAECLQKNIPCLKISKYNLFDNRGDCFKKSKHYMTDMVTNTCGNSLYIYQDKTIFEIKRTVETKTNRVYIVGASSGGYYKVEKRSGGELVVNEDSDWLYCSGLKNLIETNCSISSYEDSDYITCDECGEEIRQEDVFTVEDETFCEHCYNRIIRTCDECGDEYRIDDMTYVSGSGETFCDHCYEAYTSTCDECGEVFRTDDMVDFKDKILCKDCYDAATAN